ncbi:YbaB/EbfC family nucleoid-associated protein [Tsukamurella tyrosinosolvens]|uniref:YbaB/EbfC family nucleoid-associated protein n=1 Tax=Tsukamurella tyrosinosolvens TaxID=57704 RepID=UPI0009EF4554|nr:YbaB/EbfC family nucleoid-associated protein [Tsukamurella tyrosinosolvens]RDB49077.1 YbaB/EbfC family DNA-binding protein [Tsukamurella tyrosinosolvens]WEL91820.1 YbaB/EbfC family nucleoid-associated protein [Tsukamurella tyrosinosolvens]
MRRKNQRDRGNELDTTPQFWSDAAHAEKTSEQAHEVRERLARVSGTGTAARGDVRVTVGMGGRLTGVVIAGRAMEYSGEALSAEIMTAASLAEKAAAREVHSIATEFYPGLDFWDQYTGEAER